MVRQKPGIFQRLRDWAWNPNYAQSPIEQRATYGPIFGYKDWETFKREYNLTDVGNVGVEQGMQLADVYTCINILSQSVAWLPKSLKARNESTGTRTLANNPLHILVSQQPNSYMSAYNFWTKVGVDLWGWGNHYSIIQNRTSPDDMWLLPLDAWEVTPKMLETGELIYRYKGEDIPAREMLHFRMYTKDGINGISPIRQNANLMGYAIRQQDYAHNAIGTKPTGVLMSDVPLDDAVKQKGGKAFKNKVLEGDIPVLDRLKYQSIGIPPNEAQYLETARLSTEKIYGIYRVPPIFGQNYENANFANSEQQNLVFVQHALMPALANIEQELKMKLLPTGDSRFFHINVKGLLRGDTQTRKEFYQTMLTLGVYSPKRVLELEDEPWTDDDDTKWIQGAMIPTDQAKEMNEDTDPVEDLVSNIQQNGRN